MGPWWWRGILSKCLTMHYENYTKYGLKVSLKIAAQWTWRPMSPEGPLLPVWLGEHRGGEVKGTPQVSQWRSRECDPFLGLCIDPNLDDSSFRLRWLAHTFGNIYIFTLKAKSLEQSSRPTLMTVQEITRKKYLPCQSLASLPSNPTPPPHKKVGVQGSPHKSSENWGLHQKWDSVFLPSPLFSVSTSICTFLQIVSNIAKQSHHGWGWGWSRIGVGESLLCERHCYIHNTDTLIHSG